MSRFQDRDQQNTSDESNNWRSGGYVSNTSYSSGGRNRNQDRPPVEDRPSYLKLNLVPKGQSSSEIVAPAVAPLVGNDGEDKWSKVFKESSRRSNLGSGDARLERSNEGGENRGGGGYNDRGSNRGRGYGGDRGYGDRGDNRGDRGDNKGDRGDIRGDRGDNRGDRPSRGNVTDDAEIMNDPRFAGKFASSSGGQRQGDRRNRDDRPYGGRSGDSRSFGGYQSYNSNSDETMPLPTAPRSSMSSTPVSQPFVPLGPTPAEIKSLEDAKVAKAAKKLEREEAERKAREAKEAAALAAQEALEKKKTEHSIALAAAADAIATGLKGDALMLHVNSTCDPKPSGGALLKEVLACSNDVVNSKWWTKEEYGDVLTFLLESSVPAQITALYAVQAYCHEKKFPKIEVKGATRKLIEYIFTLLLTCGIIEPEGYLGWADDENLSDVGGRVDAIVQTTTFIHSIRQLDAVDFNEEEEEVDAPRQTVR